MRHADEAGNPPAALTLMQSPAAHVVAECAYTGPDSLGHPDPADQVADLGADPRQLVVGQPEPAASSGLTQSGWELASSFRYLALPERV